MIVLDKTGKYEIMQSISNGPLYFFPFLHLRVVLSYFNLMIKVTWWREGAWGGVDGKSLRSDGWIVSASCSARTLANGNTFLLHERKTLLRQSNPSTKRMKRLHKRLIFFSFHFALLSDSLLTRLYLGKTGRRQWDSRSVFCVVSWYRNLISLSNCADVFPFSCRSSSSSSAFAFHGLAAIYLYFSFFLTCHPTLPSPSSCFPSWSAY